MPDYLTTSEVAQLLRIKERKVYDLASSGQLPCNKAIGKLLFPRDQINAWLANNAEHAIEPLKPRPAVFLGSHDPLLEWALRESRCNLAMLFEGSSDGLQRFINREGIAAGLHIHNAKDQSWNTHAVKQHCSQSPVVLIEWALRQRGLIVAPDCVEKITSIDDLRGTRVVPRQAEAGAQVLFEQLIGQSALATDSINCCDPARTESDVAASINAGLADVGFGLATVAASYNLHFVPLVEERFDLLIDRQHYFEPPVQTLLDFCLSERFEKHVTTLTGYDVTGLGTVRFNGAST